MGELLNLIIDKFSIFLNKRARALTKSRKREQSEERGRVKFENFPQNRKGLKI